MNRLLNWTDPRHRSGACLRVLRARPRRPARAPAPGRLHVRHLPLLRPVQRRRPGARAGVRSVVGRGMEPRAPKIDRFSDVDGTHQRAELLRWLDRIEQSPQAVALRSRSYELLPVAPGAAVIDVGCGAGRAVDELAGRGIDIAGLDASAYLVDVARSRFPGRPFRGGRVRRCRTETAPSRDTAPSGSTSTCAPCPCAGRGAARARAWRPPRHRGSGLRALGGGRGRCRGDPGHLPGVGLVDRAAALRSQVPVAPGRGSPTWSSEAAAACSSSRSRSSSHRRALRPEPRMESSPCCVPGPLQRQAPGLDGTGCHGNHHVADYRAWRGRSAGGGDQGGARRRPRPACHPRSRGSDSRW